MIQVESNDKLITRLQSASGHLASVVKMMESGRSSTEVLQQLAAVQAALGKINLLVYNQELDTFARLLRDSRSKEQHWQGAQKLLELFHLRSQ